MIAENKDMLGMACSFAVYRRGKLGVNNAKSNNFRKER